MCSADYTGRHCEGKQLISISEFSILTNDRTSSSPGNISLDLLYIYGCTDESLGLWTCFKLEKKICDPIQTIVGKKKTDPFSGNKRKNIMKYVHIVINVHLFIFAYIKYLPWNAL